MEYPSLVTEQLLLETTNTSHASFLYRLMNSDGWIRYIGNRNIHTPEDAENYIVERILPQLEIHGHTSFTITLRASGLPIGICGLYIREGLEAPDLGFALLPEFKGRGLAKEAASQVMDFGFQTLKLETILAITLPENMPSRRLLGHLGFRVIGDFQFPGEEKKVLKFRKTSPLTK